MNESDDAPGPTEELPPIVRYALYAGLVVVLVTVLILVGVYAT